MPFKPFGIFLVLLERYSLVVSRNHLNQLVVFAFWIFDCLFWALVLLMQKLLHHLL